MQQYNACLSDGCPDINFTQAPGVKVYFSFPELIKKIIN